MCRQFARDGDYGRVLLCGEQVSVKSDDVNSWKVSLPGVLARCLCPCAPVPAESPTTNLLSQDNLRRRATCLWKRLQKKLPNVRVSSSNHEYS